MAGSRSEERWASYASRAAELAPELSFDEALGCRSVAVGLLGPGLARGTLGLAFLSCSSNQGCFGVGSLSSCLKAKSLLN